MNNDQYRTIITLPNIGFIGGILGFIFFYVFQPPSWYTIAFQNLYSLSPSDALLASVNSMKAISIVWLVIALWLTEALPLPITALLPAIFSPFLSLLQVKNGVVQELPLSAILSNYTSTIVFLFLGGFIIAQALTKHSVEQRWASWLLSKKQFAKSPQRIILGLMLISAFISMWVNNTATSAMLIPVAIGIATRIKDNAQNALSSHTENFMIVGVLAVAWSASIGGIGTLVGSAPNGIAVGNLKQATGIIISFSDWVLYGLPIVLILLPIAWKLLFVLLPTNSIKFADIPKELLQFKSAKTPAQNRVIRIFVLTALLWVSVPFLKDIPFDSLKTVLKGFTEWTIPLICSLLFFVIPTGKISDERLLQWKDVQKIDWGTLLLFGGGLALSSILFQTGTMEVCTKLLIANVGTVSEPVITLLFGFFVNFSTELTSNIALTSIISPVGISIAKQLSISVEPLLMVIAITASFAFMLPVGTPPNAIAYSTGKIPLSVMIKCGFLLNIISTIIAWAWILIVYSFK